MKYGICSECGGITKRYDKVERLIKTKGGAEKRVWIVRTKCTKCGAIHRILPKNILPYKHYEKDIIDGVRENLIDSDTLGYEDYPCEKTMERWKNEFSLELAF